jgi:hypothetical protein
VKRVGTSQILKKGRIYQMSIRNKEGLSRDIYLAIEHFGDIQEARQYIIEEFKNEYTEAELNATFDEVAKSFLRV